MDGRPSITARPPFSCFKRSTKLRLRTRSQVISGAWDSVDAIKSSCGGTGPPQRDTPAASASAARVGLYISPFLFRVRGSEARMRAASAVHIRLRQVQHTHEDG